MTPNRIVFTLAALVSCLVAESALAGPDWDAIERGRAVKKAEQAKRLAPEKAGGQQKCQPSAALAIDRLAVASRPAAG